MVIKELIKNFLTFYKNLFSENVNLSKNEVNQFLSLIFIPEVTRDQSRYYGFILSGEISPPCFKEFVEQQIVQRSYKRIL